MDDTKLLVDGVEIPSNEPTKVNFEELEKMGDAKEDEDDEDDDEDEDESIDEDDDEDDDDEPIEDDTKEKAFKSDVILDRKVNKKIMAQAAKDFAAKGRQRMDRSILKKKALEDSDNENAIYKSENIPRTKKLSKLEKKKSAKKEKRNSNRRLSH